MAQGCDPLFCAQFAAFLHGHVGDMLASRQGDRGTIATDIINEIPVVLQQFA
jgi:NAD(P)H-hydrate repair Nnr-like enzyme with NAD(P)H-hydrate dehydratase domain